MGVSRQTGRMEDIKAAVKEAEKLLDELVSSVGGVKPPTVAAKDSAPPVVLDEATRRANVRRRWRILAMKVRFGLGASVMAVKARNLKDAASFIDKETEEATKEDQMDLEGKCMRIKKDKRHFRRGGVAVGSTAGRDMF